MHTEMEATCQHTDHTHIHTAIYVYVNSTNMYTYIYMYTNREQPWGGKIKIFPFQCIHRHTHACTRIHAHTNLQSHKPPHMPSHPSAHVSPVWGGSCSYHATEASSWLLPPCLPQDSVKDQLLVALEHGACDTGSCLHALSVFLGNTHIQLRYSGSINSATWAMQGLCSLGSLCSLLLQGAEWICCPLSLLCKLRPTPCLPSTHSPWISVTIPSRFPQLNLLPIVPHAPISGADTLSQRHLPSSFCWSSEVNTSHTVIRVGKALQ